MVPDKADWIVLVSDIVESRNLVAHLDWRAQQGILSRHNEITERTLHSLEAALVTNQGDGYFAVFARATNAFEAALRLKNELTQITLPSDQYYGNLRIRLALHAGPLNMMHGGAWHGSTIRIASDVCKVATPDSVVATDAAYDHFTKSSSFNSVKVSDGGWHALRESENPYHLWVVESIKLDRRPGVREENTARIRERIRSSEVVPSLRRAFICHRRKSAGPLANWMRERLLPQGIECFVDVQNLDAGDWEQQLMALISAAKNFILILTDDVFARCNDPEDTVRKEVELALSSGKYIYLIFMPGFEKAELRDLPESMKPLSRLNGWLYPDDNPGIFIDDIGRRLKS